MSVFFFTLRDEFSCFPHQKNGHCRSNKHFRCPLHLFIWNASLNDAFYLFANEYSFNLIIILSAMCHFYWPDIKMLFTLRRLPAIITLYQHRKWWKSIPPLTETVRSHIENNFRGEMYQSLWTWDFSSSISLKNSKTFTGSTVKSLSVKEYTEIEKNP